jgi:hypothetical protein
MSLATMVQTAESVASELEFEYRAMRQEIAEDVTAPQLAVLLATIRDARADLASFYKHVEADVMALAGEKRFVVEGLGEFEIKRSTKRNQWDNDGLTRRLVAMALDERKLDEASGEYEPAWEAVGRVLSECARPSWRVTPLRARGLQVDEWCHEEPGAYSVMLPPRAADVQLGDDDADN